ncbi:MAG: hypothetical protein EOO38_08190 [Cytophagaceae bacterium]|nr:MAG: hypothetical protein EOO38_08190 [Cytophagaceae bacterium]
MPTQRTSLFSDHFTERTQRVNNKCLGPTRYLAERNLWLHQPYGRREYRSWTWDEFLTTGVSAQMHRRKEFLFCFFFTASMRQPNPLGATAGNILLSVEVLIGAKVLHR